MAPRKPPAVPPVRNILDALDEALGLLDDQPVPRGRAVSSEPPESLLDQCLELCAQRDALQMEPVRTLHHFACTGGTMITKCLAAMPNTQVLSEVDPLSTLLIDATRGPTMSPTDLALQMRQSTRGASDELIARMFLQSLELIYAETKRVGQRLLLRDHSHSRYCHGPAIPARPGLRELVASRFPTVSAVTVRHPLDSYASLVDLGWLSYTPPGLDEYCRRYLIFLADHGGLPIVRYEDILESPQRKVRELCDHLLLPFSEDFASLFDVFRLTGDSGRTGGVIRPRTRRPIGEALAREAGASSNFRRLCARLQYEQ